MSPSDEQPRAADERSQRWLALALRHQHPMPGWRGEPHR
jgi:hypothetical protein